MVAPTDAYAGDVIARSLVARAQSEAASIIFPNMTMRTLSTLIHLIGTSILAFCFARRTTGIQWLSLTSTPFARILVAIVFFDSWLFIFIGGTIITGPGLSYGSAPCNMAIYLCILLYGASKVFIYWFLVEKVHIVWSTSTGKRRLSSPVYKICMATMACYGIIVILMLISRVVEFRQTGECVIGLEKRATIPLLGFDLYLNCFLTGMFVWPLYTSKIVNPRLKRVALRTLVAATAALVTSAANVLILVLMHGRQLGWVCLGSCGTDVTLNALALYWVTGGKAESESPEPSSHTGPVSLAVVTSKIERSNARPMSTLRPTNVITPFTTYPPPGPFKADKVSFQPQAKSGPVKSTAALLKRMGNAVRPKQDADDEDHKMSVQVTVTYDHMEHPDDTLYNTSSEDVREKPHASDLSTV